jgi:hypothetical protein
MKKCHHLHVVQLYEAIDDPMSNKIYMGAYMRSVRALQGRIQSCQGNRVRVGEMCLALISLI